MTARTLKRQTWIAGGMALAAAMAMPGRASDGTITFTGAVTTNSCSINVNATGSSDGTIALPVVDTTALDNSSTTPNTAGTFFDIAVSNCGAPAQVGIYFEAGPGVDAATHGLINSGTSNVEVKLYLASGTSVVGTQITPGVGGSGQPAAQLISDTGTQYFYAAYSLPDGVPAQPGTVITTVTYSLVYN